MTLFPNNVSPAARLSESLEGDSVLQIPGCYDALSARLIERNGFQAGFLGGFSMAAARLGLPDMGLLSYSEAVDTARTVCAGSSIPIIGDADTGYGNPINAQRSLLGYANAGLACIMIEDQVWPKRCGHTEGKTVVPRDEAISRIRACRQIREQHGLDILIMARTDAMATDGFEEALYRTQAFSDEGADITFLEAPESTDQMEAYCRNVSGYKTANLVEDGRTPWLSPEQLTSIGYSLVLYPVSLLLHNIASMNGLCADLKAGLSPARERASFDEARELLGWGDYEATLASLKD